MDFYIYVLIQSYLGLSKGVGFIRFDQRVEAERAIQVKYGEVFLHIVVSWVIPIKLSHELAKSRF